MSDDFRRRRRLSNTGSPRRGGGGNGINPWVITIFAALAVIAGGWFLGQAIAHVFNGPPKTERVAQAPTAQPVITPVPSASPQATSAAVATASPTPSPKPKPTPEPSPTLTASPTAAPTETPTPAPSQTPAAAATATPATRHTLPIGRRTESPATSAPPQAEGPAARVVRAYIDALRGGNPAQASAYLGNGSPDESFIDSATRVNSVTESANGDGSYKVSVDMQTSKGEYYETFTVASGKILDKTAIKP